MTFAEHLRKGIERARAASAANRSIDEVLARFLDEVNQVTPGLSKRAGELVAAGPIPTDPLKQSIFTPSWLTESEQLVLDRGVSERHVICRISRSADGFPVQLTYADAIAWCENRQELEDGLGRMLENAKIAAILQPAAVAATG